MLTAVDHHPLLRPRPRLRRRARQVRGAVPRAARRARAQRDRQHAVLRVRRRSACSPTLVAIGRGLQPRSRLPASTPEQAQTGKWILLIIGVNVAMNFPFSVFGGVINGFQRYDLNNMVAIVSSVAVAVVNVVVLLAGYGLIALVAATTAVRVRRVFHLPAQRLPGLSRAAASGSSLVPPRAGCARSTGFSVYSSIIDWANKLNYQLDALVIGAFIGSGAVAVWARGRADHLGHAAADQPVERRALPGRSSTAMRRSQIARLQQILLAGHAAVARHGGADRRGARSCWRDPLIHAWVGRRRSHRRRGAGHPDSRGGRRDPRRQRDRHHAAQGRRPASHARVRQLSDRRRRTWSLSVAADQAASAWSASPSARSSRSRSPSIFILFPAACRRVGSPSREALRHARAGRRSGRHSSSGSLLARDTAHLIRHASGCSCCRQAAAACCTSRCSSASRSDGAIAQLYCDGDELMGAGGSVAAA